VATSSSLVSIGDIGGKFDTGSTGVVDSGGYFAAGVNDAGGSCLLSRNLDSQAKIAAATPWDLGYIGCRNRFQSSLKVLKYRLLFLPPRIFGAATLMLCLCVYTLHVVAWIIYVQCAKT
jgi:hypothetical protein